MLVQAFFIACKTSYIFLALLLLNPNKVYKGQKLIKLVNKNTPHTASKTHSNVPVVAFIANRLNDAARRMRMIRSDVPIFFFMTIFFCG